MEAASRINSIKDNIFSQITEIEKLKQSIQTNGVKYAGPVTSEQEIIAAVNSILDSQITGWFGIGEKGSQFEKGLCKYLDIEHSVFTNSGSSGNLLAVAALAAQKLIKPGDEAITPATTFPTTINPLLLYGIKPCFIDISLPSYTINLEQLQESITKKTKLIMLPHLNGSANDMKTIMKIAKANGIYVIEDCCDAFASRYDGNYVGTYGHLSTFSFYAAHHFTTGEGGAVMTNSKDLHDTVRSLRDWGRAPVNDQTNTKRKISFQKSSKDLPADHEVRYTYLNVGYNLKPLDLQGAIGIEQLKKVEQFTKIRKANYKFFYDSLQEYDRSLILPEGLPRADNSWFVFPIVLSNNAKFGRQKIIQFLEARGIETRPILAGNIMKHPAYRNYSFKHSKSLINSNNVLKSGFFIGVYQGISDTQREFIVKAFKEFLG